MGAEWLVVLSFCRSAVLPKFHLNPAPLLPVMEKEKRNVSAYTKKQVAASQGWKCARCKELLDATFETDHITPLHQGGSNDITNLQSLCPNCHSIKTMEERAENVLPPTLHYFFCSKCKIKFSPYFQHFCADQATSA